ncbi:hypothetical protein D3C81_1611580 [compost metagenome]
MQHLLEVHFGVTEPRYGLSVSTNLTLLKISRDVPCELTLNERYKQVDDVRQYLTRLWVLLCNRTVQDGLSLKLVVVNLIDGLCQVNPYSLLLYALSIARRLLEGTGRQHVTRVIQRATLVIDVVGSSTFVLVTDRRVRQETNQTLLALTVLLLTSLFYQVVTGSGLTL